MLFGVEGVVELLPPGVVCLGALDVPGAEVVEVLRRGVCGEEVARGSMVVGARGGEGHIGHLWQDGHLPQGGHEADGIVVLGVLDVVEGGDTGSGLLVAG